MSELIVIFYKSMACADRGKVEVKTYSLKLECHKL